ncbi:CLUMA_CG016369, isoform A [Clunio marinus]|uniref:RING-type E3 ubiquitin transferase n=1 Tax=Clunio marinus TaxID=568069 RepID=A0A1J1IUC9_9DIPT|nr:CLUMA_CG016369, isoform A [Clunio marinus]
METPERLENCPPTPEEVLEGSSSYLEEARVSKLKLLENNICVICYSSVKEGQKSFPECCLHIFCFECLCKWSKQKNQCPLCKKDFDIIIHNVKSKTEYDRHQVIVANRGPSDSPINLSDLVIPIVPIELNSVFHRVNFVTNHSPRRRFTYRTRFEATLEQNERIQELFGSRSENDYTRLTPAEWRRYIYDRNLYALPLPDLTGRHRECSAEFYRENPAQTHRLIPWLNRELVVLMPPNHTNAIPQILEEMREHLCLHDIQSRLTRDYFIRYLHDKTDHFIHEFYNFAISPYDIVGYDRSVDYSPRPANVTTVEISSNESSDGEVQVIDEGSPGNSGTSVIRVTPENVTTEVVLETTGPQEDNCRINDMNSGEIAENVPPASSEVVVESSDSECQFVLALKPPHLRTPEQVSLDSASDSDVVFIPNPVVPKSIYSSSSDTEDNKPLSETRNQLKSEMCENKFNINLEIKNDESNPDASGGGTLDDNLNLLNFGASTSTASQPDDIITNQKKFYHHPIRKRVTGKSIFDSSSSDSSSTTSKSDTSDDEWRTKTTTNKSKSSKSRRKSSKNFKKRRMSSTIVSNPKPLSQLPSSEEAHDNDGEAIHSELPRVKSVIIRKFDDQHYVQQKSSSSEQSNSE